ncbi:UTP--glucose-1-phosphate uridylyltransferase [bacterium (Candidatus Torokbacteria) CG09_land_8_20_14_0_10_42_11]|nr:MAG: UTP--glucose-1-phosphate uridylyltransferase [bacterium (Candidatus Torokbacteria) CG09_land_8_20_14_0_10_42_11]
MPKITKAIITAAGYGTRFLPATKVQPKEMLPIIDKPIIQYLVEEAVASGITDIIIVTRAGLHSLEDHFDSAFEIEHQLEENGKTELLGQLRALPKMANFIYLRQTKDLPYGNGSPLLAAKHLIAKGEAFVYMFGDDLVKAKVPATRQLIRSYNKFNAKAALAVQEIPWEETIRYGTVEYKKGTKQYQITKLLEKMPQDKAPSNMASYGRYVLSDQVITELENTPLGKGNELWLPDAINRLAKKAKVIAAPIDGKWLTTGDPLRYMKAMVEFALERKDIGPEFIDYLKTLKL